jgi:phage I-like protein
MAVAACSMALTAGGELQLLPAGSFSARDGRPTDAPGWRIDAALAQTLAAAAIARTTPYVIDYEHQTMLARQNGQPAPAAGWFTGVEWREGVGLFATGVQWTDRAKAMIAAGEYRYISPVIAYDKSGAVTALFMAAITNNPAIDGMDEVLLAAASAHFAASKPTARIDSPSQENQMDKELREQLRLLLNMPVGASDADIKAQMQKVIDDIKEDQSQGATAAASLDLLNFIAHQRTTIASLTSAAPDPAKYVAIGMMTDLQGKVATLSAQLNAKSVDEVVKAGLAAGKLIPAQEAWAREYGAKDLAALSSYIGHAPPIALLAGMQTAGKDPNGGGSAALTADQVAMCTAMGLSQEDFQKTLKSENAL